jgi:hypothetical protein
VEPLTGAGRPRLHAPQGNHMVAIVGRGKGAKLTFSSFGIRSPNSLMVASTEESLEKPELTSVVFTSARKLLRASVVKTECSLLILLGAEDCPTSCS